MGKHLFPTPLRYLAALYAIAIDAGEGAVLGFCVFVFLVWTWPFPPPDWAVGTEQLDWGLGFAGFGAGIGGYRSWLAQRRRLARGNDDE